MFNCLMPLLMATSAFGSGRRRWSSPQQCYLQCLKPFPQVTENNSNSQFQKKNQHYQQSLTNSPKCSREPVTSDTQLIQTQVTAGVYTFKVLLQQNTQHVSTSIPQDFKLLYKYCIKHHRMQSIILLQMQHSLSVSVCLSAGHTVSPTKTAAITLATCYYDAQYTGKVPIM